MVMAAREPWISAEDVAKHLGVVKDTVYRWTRDRDLPAHRVGRLLKFRLSEVDRWIARMDTSRDRPGERQ
jgi:excisionase family DNA binding protein